MSFLDKRYVRNFLFSLIIIPIGVYVWSIIKFTVNIPFFDDFFWSFTFLDEYQHSDGVWEKFTLILGPHNEHRMIMTRLTVILLTSFGGALNLKAMTWIGNLFIFGVFGVLFLYLQKSATKLLWLVPVAFFWFQLQYFQNTVTSYSVPNNSVIFFAFAAILSFYYSVNEKGNMYFCLTLLLASITTFCNGNGIAMLPIIGVLYAFNREWKRVMTTAGMFVIIAFLYLNGLPLDGNKVTFSTKTGLFFIDFLTVSIAPLSQLASRIIGSILLVSATAIALSWIIDSFKKRMSAERLFLVGTYGFIVGTATVTAIMRASYNLAPAPWYKGYSLLFVISCGLIITAFIPEARVKKIFYLVTLACAFFNFYQSTLLYVPQFNAFRNQLVADGINFTRNNKWAFIPIQANNDNYVKFNTLTEKMISNGNYHLPVVPKELLFDVNNVQFDNEVEVSSEYDSFAKVEVITYQPATYLKKHVYGFSYNPTTKELVLHGVYQPLNGKKAILGGQNLYLPVYTFAVNREYFKQNATAGTYVTGFITFADGGKPVWLRSDVKATIVNI